jgi:uncharacterized protein DUF4249
MKLINFSLLLISSIVIFSCEKSISFQPKQVEPKLVVEATIENNQPPVVFLTKSLAFFSEIDPAVLQNSFVHNAQVFVSNGVLMHKLKEYAVLLGGGYNIFYYSVDSANLATSFVGQLDHTYSLNIQADGKTYTATTTIPRITKQVDSLFWQPAPPGNDSDDVAIMSRVTDPQPFGDYVRYFTKRNQEPFYAPFASTFDDQLINGTTYTVQVERGWDRNTTSIDHSSYFKKGDTVTIKLCNIDKATYDFWRTLEYSYGNLGNPFATPTNVLSNIHDNALGYFGGYAAQFRTIIIPK